MDNVAWVHGSRYTVIFVILGMHKSGTTLLAQTLHHSGIDMGVDCPDKSYDAGEQFERLLTQEFNMEMLNCDQSTFSLKVYQPIQKDKISSYQQKALEMCGLLSEKHGGEWGFKDPRTCLAWPVWKQVMKDYKVMGVWRDPREVLSHYVSKRPWYKQSPTRLIRAYRTLRAWYYHNQCILEALKDENQGLLFEYDSMMSGEKPLKELEVYVGRPLKDVRNKKMRRSACETTLLYLVAKGMAKVMSMDIDHMVQSLKARSI